MVEDLEKHCSVATHMGCIAKTGFPCLLCISKSITENLEISEKVGAERL